MRRMNKASANRKTLNGQNVARKARKHSYIMEEQVGFLLRLANQRHTRIFTQKMIGGLTTTQFAALTKLYFTEKCTQNRLGDLIAIDAVTIKGVVDRLTAKGLVKIVVVPQDRRRRSISISDQGREIIRRALPVGSSITKATLSPLSAGDQKEFLQLLKRVANLREVPPANPSVKKANQFTPHDGDRV